MSNLEKEKDDHDIFDDKKDVEAGEVTVNTKIAEDNVLIDVHTGIHDGVQRKMKQRHMQMIALAGTLGTGLFLGSGKAIAHAGPAGALLSYITVGSIAYSMMMSLGEMTCYAPISGGYIHFADRWVDEALGFALGWQVWYSSAISLPTEVISSSIIISFWDNAFPKSHQIAYILVLIFLSAIVNYLGVRWFGESEFIFAVIKIALVLGLIIGGLVVDLGGGPDHDRIGFRYWNEPGAFATYLVSGNTGKFLGWFTTLLQAAYSFSGLEGIALAAAEVENPRQSVAKAVRRIFLRILLFYVFGILIIGMLVPYDDPNLLQSTGTSASSPFVIAFKRAGISALPSVINAGVLSSAFSAANSGIYVGSRQLYGLALRGQAPAFLAYTNKRGVPVITLTLTVSFLFLSFMSLSRGASTALNWLSNLTSISGFITWGTISFTYVQFLKGVKAQKIDRSKFTFKNRFQPIPAWWAFWWSVIIVFFNGYTVFISGQWSATDFVISYINVPIFFGLFFFWKFFKGTKWRKPVDMDFFSNIPPMSIDTFKLEPVSWKNPAKKIGDIFFG